MKYIYIQIAIGMGTLVCSFSFSPFKWALFYNVSKNSFCLMVGPFVIGALKQSKDMMEATMKQMS
jgi:hypothetical protein